MNKSEILVNEHETNYPLKEFLNTTLNELMEMTRADCGSLCLFDSKNNELVLDVFHNTEKVNIQGFRQRMGEGISGKVANLMSPVLVKNIDKDSRFRRNGFKHYRTKSFISLPIFCSGKLLGLINLTDKSNGKAFTEEDLNTTATIAKYTSLALGSLKDGWLLKQEKETLENQKALLEKYASVGKLAAEVVHEINNPLDGVIRFTNILLNRTDNNSVSSEYLIEVKKGLERIANITKSLRVFSQLTNTASCENKKYVDVNVLIQESLDILGESIPQSIRINKNFSQGIGRVLDLGLSHIIINIMKNAIDAMPEGGKLDIATNFDEKHIKICFKDTGIGIPHEIKPRIFEPFFTTKSKEKGTGLGLAISRGIIAKYEGTISVDSFPGQGSCFEILIPRRHIENG